MLLFWLTPRIFLEKVYILNFFRVGFPKPLDNLRYVLQFNQFGNDDNDVDEDGNSDNDGGVYHNKDNHNKDNHKKTTTTYTTTRNTATKMV